ncbi:MAG: hypothetical protein IJY00_02165 [Bacteroidaceae bacterium]|nr:hypothetical protein [Bacteroidaceae bacterium]
MEILIFIFIIVIGAGITWAIGDDKRTEGGTETNQPNESNKPQHQSTISYQSTLSLFLSIFAWIELVCGIILAFVFGFVKKSHYSDVLEFDAAMFFGMLFAGIISFMIFQSFAVFVKAANKYLNS